VLGNKFLRLEGGYREGLKFSGGVKAWFFGLKLREYFLKIVLLNGPKKRQSANSKDRCSTAEHFRASLER